MPGLKVDGVMACKRDRRCRQVLEDLPWAPPILPDVMLLLPDQLLGLCLTGTLEIDDLARHLRRLDGDALVPTFMQHDGKSSTLDFGDICASGIPCVDYSSMGRRQQERGPTLVVIAAWARALRARRPSIAIVENVPQFRMAILEALHGDV